MIHLITERSKSCVSARKLILEHQENLFFLVEYYQVRLNNKSTFEGPHDAEPIKSMEHIYDCSRCERWLDNDIPPKYTERPFRVAHYCCYGMFEAVEENEEHEGCYKKSTVRFDKYATSSGGMWRIADWFISCCPWCGAELPNKPFRDEALW